MHASLLAASTVYRIAAGRVIGPACGVNELSQEGDSRDGGGGGVRSTTCVCDKEVPLQVEKSTPRWRPLDVDTRGGDRKPCGFLSC